MPRATRDKSTEWTHMPVGLEAVILMLSTKEFACGFSTIGERRADHIEQSLFKICVSAIKIEVVFMNNILFLFSQARHNLLDDKM